MAWVRVPLSSAFVWLCQISQDLFFAVCGWSEGRVASSTTTATTLFFLLLGYPSVLAHLLYVVEIELTHSADPTQQCRSHQHRWQSVQWRGLGNWRLSGMRTTFQLRLWTIGSISHEGYAEYWRDQFLDFKAPSFSLRYIQSIDLALACQVTHTLRIKCIM